MTKVANRFPSVLDRVNWYPKTASVACSSGDWVTIASGYVARAVSTTANILGVANADWTNNSANTLIPVREDEYGLWVCDTSTAPVQATHVGNAYDLTDHDEVNFGATTYKVVTCLGITPDARGLFRINMHFGSKGHI
ncbi:hypothetical protein KW797_00075 [Candidatus Parcubacteria bacterium]|nr:hypothetical protein [Candidatus Parcubacteria bacterium]